MLKSRQKSSQENKQKEPIVDTIQSQEIKIQNMQQQQQQQKQKWNQQNKQL